MKWLILVTLILAAQQPAKSPESKRITETQSALHQGQTNKSNDSQKAATNLLSPTQSAHQITARTAASEAAKAQENQEDLNIQRRLVWFTGLLVAVGAIQAGIFIWQAIVFRRTLRAMQNGQRAWIVASFGELPEFAPNVSTLEILWLAPTLKNYGQTPATMTKVLVKPERVAAGYELPADADYSGPEVRKIEYETTFPPGMSTQPLKVPLPTSDFVQVNDGTMTQYVHGMVEYRDIHERKHCTRFCFIYHVQSGYNPDPSGFYIGGPAGYNRST